jgi:hypothetical protein
MDLTKEFPRSAKDKIAGVVMIARTTDKAKAKLSDTIGEYHYNCPMDQGVLGFLGIDHEQYLEAVKNAKSDADIEAFVKSFASKKSQAEIDSFNTEFLNKGPEKGTEADGYFQSLLKSLDPSRTDITAWPDLLDLDEKRPVPRRTAAAV